MIISVSTTVLQGVVNYSQKYNLKPELLLVPIKCTNTFNLCIRSYRIIHLPAYWTGQTV